MDPDSIFQGISIRNPDPESGSGFRRAKISHIIRNKLGRVNPDPKHSMKVLYFCVYLKVLTHI
jgi:hypothetical protein